MSAKITRSMLSNLIREEMRVLSEATRLSQDSLDDQIDAILLGYEQSSKVEEITDEVVPESYSLCSALNYLFEAPEDEDEDEDEGEGEEGEDEEGEDEGEEGEEGEEASLEDEAAEMDDMINTISGAGYSVNKTVDNSGREVTVSPETAELKVPINIDIFTNEVARLIINHSSLLSIPEVIINRTRAFLEEKYDAASADEFIESLKLQHGIDLSGDRPESPQAPYAAGAGPAGGGA
jgi:cobalamin biosynthesis protein CobT